MGLKDFINRLTNGKGLFDSEKPIKRPPVIADNSKHILNYKFLNGEDCDIIKGSYGEFGKTFTNPIPVNGPNGALLYLNSLRDINNNVIFYHRLTSIKKINSDEAIDVYELVDVNGSFWDIVYLDMYHPRNSNLLPKGYLLAEFHAIFSKVTFGMGSNRFFPNFPKNMENIFNQYPVPFNQLSNQYLKFTKGEKFIRPYEHFLRLIKITNVNTFYGELLDGVSQDYPPEYFINLLIQNDFHGQFTALNCLLKLKPEDLKDYINEVCNFAANYEIEETNDLCIKLVELVEPEFKSVFEPIMDSIKNEELSVFRNSKFVDMLINRDLGKLSIPYLIKIKNTDNITDELYKRCVRIINELKYE
jgi:hypothetical protein